MSALRKWDPEVETGIMLAGASLVPDISGVLHWPAERLIVVADLHLERGSSHARTGQLLPPFDTAETLRRLGHVVDRLKPRRVIALGDSFHDPDAHRRLGDRDRAALAKLQRGRDFIWISGNHDPVPTGLPGDHLDALTMAGLLFRHAPARDGRPEIAGHLHPTALLRRRGAGVRRRCFATDGNRLILPAFGTYCGGLDIFSAAFAGLFDPRALTAWMIGELRMFPVPAGRLAG